VRPYGTEELVSEHPDFESGWKAGVDAVTVEDKENAYSLYGRGRRVARFGHSRLMPRLGAERLPSLPGELWQIQCKIGELHEQRGQAEEARAGFSRAAQTLRMLARNIGDEKLREGFLSAARVRRVLRHN
jgi:hypothetical protein